MLIDWSQFLELDITKEIFKLIFSKGSGECSDVKLNLGCGIFKTKLL